MTVVFLEILTFGLLIPLPVAVVILLKALRNGTKLPVTRGLSMRRWVEPRGEACKIITEEMQLISMNSVGSLLPHPMLHGDVEAVGKRIVMIIHKQGKPIMFHAALKVQGLRNNNTPIFHTGLVMVDNTMKRRGMQKYALLNLFLLSFDYWKTNFILTDVGASPSGFRLFCDFTEDPFPNYRHPEACPNEEHILVAKHVINRHKPDMGISSLATFNQDTFVVKDSNKKDGGGSYQCAYTMRDGESSNSAVNAFFIERIGGKPLDEVFSVGRYNFFKTVTKMTFGILKKHRF